MRRYFLIVPLLVATLAGCAGNPPEPGTAADESCELVGFGEPMERSQIRVFMPYFNPEIPHEETCRSLVGGESMLVVDCEGHVRPGIAALPEGHGRHVVLTLPAWLRFSDGAPVNAEDMVKGWNRAIAGGIGVDSVRAIDDRRIEVFLERPDIRTLATPHLLFTPSGNWPIVWGRSSLNIYGRDIHDDQRDADLIDAGDAKADMIIVQDPNMAAYAAERDRAVSPLPYNRT